MITSVLPIAMEQQDQLEPAGELSDAERDWTNDLVLCGQLGWRIVGRDALGQLVAATIVDAGRSAPDTERYCTITRSSAGLVCGTTRRRRTNSHGG